MNNEPGGKVDDRRGWGNKIGSRNNIDNACIYEVWIGVLDACAALMLVRYAVVRWNNKCLESQFWTHGRIPHTIRPKASNQSLSRFRYATGYLYWVMQVVCGEGLDFCYRVPKDGGVADA
jgi:hypothetical protein